MSKIIAYLSAVFLVLAPSVSVADGPDVMWRSATSGTLAVNPLADPTTPPSPTPTVPAEPTTPTGPGAQPLILEVSSSDLYFKNGVQATGWVMVSNGIMPIKVTLSGKLPAGIAFAANSNGDGQAFFVGTPASTASSSEAVDIQAVDAVGKTSRRKVNIHTNVPR